MYCFFTSRKASSAPRLSNLFSAMISAKSSISIFSSCVAAPYSGVITYMERLQWSMISVSDCPMPDVSSMMRSNPAACNIVSASFTYFDMARFDCRVASERIYTLVSSMEFILIRSPSSAPPVFLFDGSTEMIPMVLSG